MNPSQAKGLQSEQGAQSWRNKEVMIPGQSSFLSYASACSAC